MNDPEIIALLLAIIILIVSMAYFRGLEQEQANYTAALRQVHEEYTAELEARQKIHLKYELIYYAVGILVGAFCLWAWLKRRE